MNFSRNKSVWLLSIVFSFLVAPLLYGHFEILWRREHYQWFPLLFIFVLVNFTLQWRKSELATTVSPRWILQGIVFFGILLTAVAYLYYTTWVAMAATIVLLGALAAHLSSFRQIDKLFGLWMLLFLFVRVPNQIESRVLILFQNISAKLASIAIDLSGVYHVVQGDFLIIEEYEISLRKICSGHFSIIGVLVLFSLFAFIKRRPTGHVMLLLPGAFAAGAITNTMRVALFGVIYAQTGEDIVQTPVFHLVNVLSYAVSFLILLSYDALLTFFLQEVEELGGKRTGWSLVKLWNSCVSFRVSSLLARVKKSKTDAEELRPGKISGWVLAVSLLALTAFEGVILYYKWGFGDYRTYFMHDEKTLALVDAKEVKFFRPGWEVLSVTTEEREMSSIWGAYSTIWRLKYYDTVVVMALDYPFDKWHDVKRCYTKMGWQVQTEGLLASESYQEWGASKTELVLPTGDYGFILCSHCDHLGEVVQPKPTDHQFSMVMYYLHPKQWAAPFGVSVDRNTNTFYQTQMMTTAAFELDEPTKLEIERMYGAFREQIREQIETNSVK